MLDLLDSDPQMLLIWGIVAISLALQVYLFVTWPVSSRSKQSAARADVERTVDQRNRQSIRQHESVGALQLSNGATFPRTHLGASNSASLPQVASHGGQSSDMRGGARRQKTPVTINQRIICAGIYSKPGIQTFHTVRTAACLTMLCGGFLVTIFLGFTWLHGLIVAALAGLGGYLGPSFWLDRRLRVRQTKIRRALPDALDLVTVCMQGGLSLPGALTRVSQELGTAHPMLAMELAIVEREIQMGRATGDAIRQFANRFNLEELRSLSSVVSQAEKFGGSITGALRTYAESLRIKRRQRAEELAQKAAVKLLFPTLLCIFPGIFVVVLGPTAIRMYQVMVVEHPWGG